jgi:large subunit ribosomal protein L30
MAKQLKVKQVRSGVGRPQKQRVILRTLGLGKMNRIVEHKDTAMIRGMIKKVIHLVTVEEIS